MSSKYKFGNPEGTYFLSFATVEWVDVFTRKLYRDILIDSIRYCQKEKGLVLYSWCVMSNHVHFIASAKEGFALQDILRDMKKFTSKEIIAAIAENKQESRREWMLSIFRNAGKQNSNNEHFQFWQQDNQPKELLPYDTTFGKQKLDYVHNNPVEAGIVEKPEEYIYSSARDYAGLKGVLDITFLY
jgi:putative transposase